MLNIYICEDDSKQAKTIEEYVNKYLMMMDYDATMVLNSRDGSQILKKLYTDKDNALFFLDIDLQDTLNGIELAAEIKKIAPNSRIVFISSHVELTYLTFIYKVEAMDFITKSSMGDLQKRVTDCIDIAYRRQHEVGTRKEDTITIKSGEIDVFLPLDTILFFETTSIPHKIEVHCENRILGFYSSMKEIESMSEYFVRCHKSLIVNTKCIESIDHSNRVIKMKDGQKRAISVRNLKKMIEN